MTVNGVKQVDVSVHTKGWIESQPVNAIVDPSADFLTNVQEQGKIGVGRIFEPDSAGHLPNKHPTSAVEGYTLSAVPISANRTRHDSFGKPWRDRATGSHIGRTPRQHPQKEANETETARTPSRSNMTG